MRRSLALSTLVVATCTATSPPSAHAQDLELEGDPEAVQRVGDRYQVTLSAPHPRVALAPIDSEALTLDGRTARFTLRGSVASPIAPYLQSGEPAVTLAIELGDAPEPGRVELEDPRDAADGPRPFVVDVSLPLVVGDNDVLLRATDALGHVGVASVTLRVDLSPERLDRALRFDRQTGEPELSLTPSDVAVITRPGAAPGAVHPVSAVLRPVEEKFESFMPSRSVARAFLLGLGARPGPRGLELDPLLVVPDADPGRRPVEGDPPPPERLARRGGRIVTARELALYTGGAVRAVHAVDRTLPRYAAGTVVTHRFRDVDLGEWVTRARVTVLQRGEDGGFGPDPDVEVRHVTFEGGAPPEVAVRLRLGRATHRGPRRARRSHKRLRIVGPDGQRFEAGDFSVVRLRLVVVGVDGLAYASARDLLQARTGAPTLRRLFADSPLAEEPALSALPTITMCNWAGILSGLPPGRHGIVGNSFFARERETSPFVPEGLAGIRAVWGGLGDHARERGSLYDRLAALEPEHRFQAASIHHFYTEADEERVNLSKSIYWSPFALGHGRRAAETLDRQTASKAIQAWDARADELQALVLYFPGPDNLAHDVGDPSRPRPAPWPDVERPLPAIAEHFARVTDGELGDVVAAIERSGHLDATLFALVADHGLHAFHNDDARTLETSEVEDFLDEVQPLCGRFFPHWFGTCTKVYSPNGGVAHVYVRDDHDADWSDAPAPALVDGVARAIATEAANGDGELGDQPLGDPPAVFVRRDGRLRWYSLADDELRSPSAFVAARRRRDRTFAWPSFQRRLGELTDARPGSRTGDVVLFMDGRRGFLTVEDGDGYPGWHGGPTPSESYVPLMLAFGPNVDDGFEARVINGAAESVAIDDDAPLRNWQLAPLVERVYRQLYERGR